MLPITDKKEKDPGHVRVAGGYPEESDGCQLPLRVALLTNQMAPFRRTLYLLLTKSFEKFRLYISTSSEPNRNWDSDCRGLDIRVQRSISLSRTWKHPIGFEEEVYVHFPLDTLSELRRFRPHLVISCELGVRSLQAAIYRWMNPKCRLILWTPLSEHMEKGRNRFRREIRRILLRFADAVLVNGRSNSRYIEGLGYPKQKIFEVPHAVEMECLLSIDLERRGADVHRLLFVGRLVQLKGLWQFFQALAEWAANHPDRAVGVSITGEGPESRSLKRFSFPSNVRVSWIGEIPYADLPRIYGSSGVLVLPTLSDEWGLVVNEALAAGIPVLGSEYSQAVFELVREGVNGWRFVPDHLQSMRDAIDRMMSVSNEGMGLMRRRARESISWLTPEFMERQILKAVSSIMPDECFDIGSNLRNPKTEIFVSENIENGTQP